MKPLDEDDLEGFEIQLANIQEYLENFDEIDANSNFAYDKGFPDDGSFGGKLQCGFAKEKGQLKKDGSLKCGIAQFKFDFYYVQIFDKDGEFVSSCFQDEFEKSMIPEGGKNPL